MFDVYYRALTAFDASHKYISLDGVPTSPANVALDTITGTSQALNGDFFVDGTTIKWQGMGLDGTYGRLSEGDVVRVLYDRS